MGRGVREAFEPGGPPAGADRHAVPLRRQPDPVRHLRARRRRRPALGRRLHLRLRPRAGRPRRPAGAVHGLLRRDAVAHPGRRRGRGPARRAADQGPHRAGAAHRARPRRGLDPVGARGRRQAADRGTPPRARRRRAGDRHRPGLRPRLRRAAEDDHRREAPTVVLSDEKAASKKIAEFTDSDDRWMVAVRMVSEGVDVPRLAVGVYATTRRPRCSSPRRSAASCGPASAARPRRCSCRRCPTCSASPPRWRSSATTCSAARSPTRTTSSPPRTTCSPGQRGRRASDEELGPSRRSARGALRPGALRRRRVRPRGRGARRLRGGDGLPRHPRPARARPGARPAAPRQSERAAKQQRPAASTPEDMVAEVSTHEQLAVLRRELNGLVAAWHHRTGQPHGVTHAALRKECGGPAAASPPPTSSSPDRPDPRVGGPHRDLLTRSRYPRRMACRDLADARPGSAGPACWRHARRADRHRAGRGGRGQPHGRLPAGQHPRAARAGPPRRRRPAARRARRAPAGSRPSSRCSATSRCRCCARSPRRSAAPRTSRSPTATRRWRSRWSSRRGPTSTSPTGSAPGTRSTRGAAGRAILLGRGPEPAPYVVTSGELQAGARGLAAPVRGVEGLEASVGIVTLGDLDVARSARTSSGRRRVAVASTRTSLGWAEGLRLVAVDQRGAGARSASSRGRDLGGQRDHGRGPDDPRSEAPRRSPAAGRCWSGPPRGTTCRRRR